MSWHWRRYSLESEGSEGMNAALPLELSDCPALRTQRDSILLPNARLGCLHAHHAWAYLHVLLPRDGLHVVKVPLILFQACQAHSTASVSIAILRHPAGVSPQKTADDHHDKKEETDRGHGPESNLKR